MGHEVRDVRMGHAVRDVREVTCVCLRHPSSKLSTIGGQAFRRESDAGWSTQRVAAGRVRWHCARGRSVSGARAVRGPGGEGYHSLAMMLSALKRAGRPARRWSTEGQSHSARRWGGGVDA